MVSLQNIQFSFGGRVLYDEASLQIKPKDRIGLIGANGTGKSTLLRILVGEYQPDGGIVQIPKDCQIGFLHQDLLTFESSQSILHVAMQAFAEVLDLQDAIDALLKQLENDQSDSILNALAQKQEAFEALDGYTVQAQTEAILEGLGFSTEALQKPLNTFSGGWRMRVMLAKLLLENPDILLLDEPTNHLDLPSIQWLEKYLQEFSGAVIIVSHDRFFLDRTSQSIVEVEFGKLNRYKGNYTQYLKEKAVRKEIHQKSFENQQSRIKQTEQFINRFRAKSTKARQVQSKIKMLEKMDKIEEMEEDNSSIAFRFSLQQASGKDVLSLKNIQKSYGEMEVIRQAEAFVSRGDKIALIGANGKGKSTLLRIVGGTDDFEGERKLGYHVHISFFAQHQLEVLEANHSILQEVQRTGTDKTEQELRTILGGFLFSDDEVEKKIKVLSGGERSRVALAKTLISEANFLLLDEPTNHLDMTSVNRLIQALQQYEGTYILVSHDRYFVSQVANKIWYLQDGILKEYPGTYEEYVAWQAKNEQVVQKEQSTRNTKEKTPKQRDEEQKHLKKLEKELAQIEEKIEALESRKKELEHQMALPEYYGDHEKLSGLNSDYEKLKKELLSLHTEWEQVVEKVG